ncbi:hypothetical protein BCR34DRAFT_190092 [Clohesyomyces aquaticus]|uniref:Uncharacterized protein n=1 Tax=Clohesyomyces aquaticus TaxID=1231657 RepID=A0A1Y1ZY49_9PLEO|nr:hypothetical protein BCR34DRAFT_190092 [Clohesyomyces aquaticus]
MKDANILKGPDPARYIAKVKRRGGSSGRIKICKRWRCRLLLPRSHLLVSRDLATEASQVRGVHLSSRRVARATILHTPTQCHICSAISHTHGNGVTIARYEFESLQFASHLLWGLVVISNAGIRSRLKEVSLTVACCYLPAWLCMRTGLGNTASSTLHALWRSTQCAGPYDVAVEICRACMAYRRRRRLKSENILNRKVFNPKHAKNSRPPLET